MRVLSFSVSDFSAEERSSFVFGLIFSFTCIYIYCFIHDVDMNKLRVLTIGIYINLLLAFIP